MPQRPSLWACLIGAVLAAAVMTGPAQADMSLVHGGPITIADAGSLPPASPYPSSVQVSRLGFVSKVTVRIADFNHSYPNEIDLLLVGPRGQTTLLMSDVSPTAAASNSYVTFSDSAAGTVPEGVPSGTYLPTNLIGGDFDAFPAPAPLGPYGSALSAFNETDPNGTWSLFAVDQTGGDTGSIGGWTLSVTDRPAKLVSLGPIGTGTNEASGRISVSVTREAGGQAASVAYATGANSAISNGDYVPVSGTLSFAPGETTKTIEIPVVNDTAAEPTERLTVHLRTPTGDARLGRAGSGSSVTALLIDDDAAKPARKPVVKAASTRLAGKALGISVTTALDANLVASGTVSLPGRSKVVRLRSAQGTSVGGKATKLKLRIPAKAVKAIKAALKGRSLTATIRVIATDGVRRKSARTLKLRLKRAR